MPISESLKIGLDGFMINSNEKGYNIVNNVKYDDNKLIVNSLHLLLHFLYWEVIYSSN